MLHRACLISLLLGALTACAEGGSDKDATQAPSGVGGAGNTESAGTSEPSTSEGDAETDGASAEPAPSSPSADVGSPSDTASESVAGGAGASENGSETSEPGDADDATSPTGSDAEDETSSIAGETAGESEPAELPPTELPPTVPQPTVPGSDAGAQGKISCDPRQVMCRRAAPQCPEGQVPSVEGICYGACVRIDQCGCDGPEACPNPDLFTCRNDTGTCTYYLR